MKYGGFEIEPVFIAFNQRLVSLDIYLGNISPISLEESQPVN
jgi:hypothetical protein